MNNIAYEIISAFINSTPFIFTAIITIFFVRGPLLRLMSRTLLDFGRDKYNSSSDRDHKGKKESFENPSILDERIKSIIQKLLLEESSKKHFDDYKENIENLISKKKDELTNHALLNFYSESKIEEAIKDSLSNKVEQATISLIRESEGFKAIEEKALEKINLVKVSSFLKHLEKEYDATRNTKALMSNMFMVVNLIYFLGLMAFLLSGAILETPPEIYLALSFSYVGLGAFVVYMVKFCNARSLTLLSLREDYLKRDTISNMANKIIELGANEHHVALLQLMNSNIATKEQKINHPYEMLLYGIKDSNIMFKGGKFEIRKESPEKQNIKE